jgi:secernin
VCDTVAAVTADGTWFAKNSDRAPSELQVLERSPARPPGGTVQTQYLTIPDPGAFGILGTRPTWLTGLETGVNDRRVAVGNEKIWTTSPIHRAPDALLGMDLVRIALERGEDADGALAVLTSALEEHGQGGNGEFEHPEAYCSSFLVVDPHGGWQVETRGSSWVAAPIHDTVAISNRVSIRTEWTRSSADVEPGTDVDSWRHPSVDPAIADVRLAVTRPRIADGRPIDAAALASLLRDHAGAPWGQPGRTGSVPVPGPPRAGFEGLSVCMHLPGVSVTTASMIAFLPSDPTRPVEAWCAIGSPCASVFVPVDPTAPPAFLAEPTTAERFASLRRRVEGGSDALDAVRAVLAPLEAELWAVGPAGADPGPAIDAALTRLGV